MKKIIVLMTGIVICGSTASALNRLVPSEYPTIQAGIDAAVTGDTVIIANGTYKGQGNRDINFYGKAITVRGVDPNIPENCIIDCQGTEEEPHRGFKFHRGEQRDSVLSGLTITNGYGPRDGEWSGLTRFVGGAIFCSSSPTISHCIITENYAYNNAGAIWCVYGSPLISHCIISNNSARWGGGGIDCVRSSPIVNQSILIGNSARDGGGIRCWSRSNPTLLHCTIC